MKNLLIVLAYLLFNFFLFSSCKSRKVAKDYEKTKTESQVKSEIDFKEQFQDKSTFEKFLKENNYNLVLEIREDFLHDSLNVLNISQKVNTKGNIGQSADNLKNRLISRYTKLSISSNQKESGEKEVKDISQNKSLQAKKDSSGTSTRVIKKKVTEAAGLSTRQMLIAGGICIAIGLLGIFWKKVKNFLLYYILPV